MPLIAQLKTEIEANLNMIADLQDRLNRQQAQLVRPLVHGQLLVVTLVLQDKQDNGLTADFDFGRRVYQCTVPNPGVGYRNTPQFADKVLASAYFINLIQRLGLEQRWNWTSGPTSDHCRPRVPRYLNCHIRLTALECVS